MSIFRFRLQRLLDQRMRVKEDAVKNLAERQTELRREEETLALVQRNIDKLEHEILSTRRAALDLESVGAHTLVQFSDRLRGMANDADAARDALAAQELAFDHAKSRLEQARGYLAVCRREEEILTKFRDKLRQRFLEREARIEDFKQDEIANILCLARSSTQ